MSNYKKNIYKVILVGDASVGKTALANRISKNTFSAHYKATLGFDTYVFDVEIDQRNITLHIIDTAGQERFSGLTSNFYRGSHSVVLCFDVSNTQSFEKIDHWKNEFAITASLRDPNNFPFVLAATKIDLPDRAIQKFKAEKWCRINNDIPYIETSAKDNIGVTELFYTVGKQILQHAPREVDFTPSIPETIEIHTQPQNENKSGCFC